MRKSMKQLLAVTLLFATGLPPCLAKAQKLVKVGSFTVGATTSFGTAFSWTLDATAITTQPICFGGVTWIVDGKSHTFLLSSGGIGFTECTQPLIDPPFANTFGVIGCDQNTPECFNSTSFSPDGLPSCALGCTNITLQLISTTGKAFSFTLLNGKKFTTYGVNTSSMSPEPGQLYIVPGQTAPLYLYRDPSGK